MIRNRKDLAKVKRIVVKVGTSTITYPNCSRNFARIDHLCRELADLHNKGLEVILVTSGAVAVGSERLGLKEKPKTIPGKQAAAAVGQGILMNTAGPAPLYQFPQYLYGTFKTGGHPHRQRK